MTFPLGLSCLFFSVFFATGKAVESSNLQVQVSSRFIDGDDILSAPRVVTTVGQEAVIQVAREDRDDFDGVMLSITPRVADGKVLLEGFAFAGKGKLDGDDGIKSRAKKALESFTEQFEAERDYEVDKHAIMLQDVYNQGYKSGDLNLCRLLLQDLAKMKGIVVDRVDVTSGGEGFVFNYQPPKQEEA